MQETKKEGEVSWKEKINRRRKSNLNILNLIRKVVNKFPDWRFFQILTNLGYETMPDRWHDESYDTEQEIMTAVNGMDSRKPNLREGVILKVGENEYNLKRVDLLHDGSYMVYCDTFPNTRLGYVIGNTLVFKDNDEDFVIDEVVDNITPFENVLVKNIVEHGTVITELISTEDRSTLLMCDKKGTFAVVELDITDTNIHDIDFNYHDGMNYKIISPFGIHVLVENINDNLKTKYPNLKPGAQLNTVNGTVTVKDWWHMYNTTTLEREKCILVNNGKSSFLARKQDILPENKKWSKKRTKLLSQDKVQSLKTTN